MADVESTELDYYKSEWRDHPDTERWLNRIAKGESWLCFPSGMQVWGDVRADVDPSVKPDVFADINNPPFPDRSFDTVYCDPPYSLCAYDKIHSWLPEVWEITNMRLVVKMPAIEYNLSQSTYELVHERNKKGSCHLVLYHIWDRDHSQRDLGEWDHG